MQVDSKVEKKTLVTTFFYGLLCGLFICLFLWFVMTVSSRRADVQSQKIITPSLSESYATQLLKLLQKEIVTWDQYAVTNPQLNQNDEKADLQTLWHYTVQLLPKENFSLFHKVSLEGKAVYEAAFVDLNRNFIGTPTALRRKAVRQLLKYADSLLLESFIGQNGITVSPSDFTVSMEELNPEIKALVVNYNYPDRLGGDYSTGFRRIMRRKEYETNLKENREQFLEDCTQTIRLRLIAHMLKKERTVEAQEVISEPSEKNLVAYLRKKCHVEIGVPQMEADELLDILARQKMIGSSVVVFAPVPYNRSTPVSVPADTFSQRNLKPVTNILCDRIQKLYKKNTWGTMALSFEYKPGEKLSTFETWLTVCDKERVAVGLFRPLMHDPVPKKIIGGYHDSKTLWCVDSQIYGIKRADISLDDLVGPDTADIYTVMSTKLKDATRSYIIKLLRNEFAVFEYEFTDPKDKDYMLLASYCVRVEDGKLMKLKEIEFQNKQIVYSQVILYPILMSESKAKRCLNLVGSFFKEKPSEKVTFSKDLRDILFSKRRLRTANYTGEEP